VNGVGAGSYDQFVWEDVRAEYYVHCSVVWLFSFLRVVLFKVSSQKQSGHIKSSTSQKRFESLVAFTDATVAIAALRRPI